MDPSIILKIIAALPVLRSECVQRSLGSYHRRVGTLRRTAKNRCVTGTAKQTFARCAASVKKGSSNAFAARCIKGCFAVSVQFMGCWANPAACGVGTAP